jgi:hypothetical protein
MKLTDIFVARSARATMLTSAAIGWASLMIGVVTESAILLVTGGTLIAIVTLILAKALMETISVARVVPLLRESLTAGEQRAGQTAAVIDQLRERDQELGAGIEVLHQTLAGLSSDLRAQQDAIGELHAEAQSVSSRITVLVGELENVKTGSEDLARILNAVEARAAELARAHDTTRIALSATRTLTDRLAERTRSALDPRRLRQAAVNNVDQPILSVAIPSFNRPSSLADLLASIATEVAACPEGLIEVCITDDASPDPEVIETALAFVEKHRFASLRIRPSNVGLERNFLAAGEPCRGDYLLLLGNDDILVPGALTTILDDIRTTSAPVLLYAKRRINLDGSPRADLAGSTPIEIPEGATHMFDSFLAAAREQGLMSTFGFLGPIVVQRRPFLDVDPRPYLDLTMYAPLAVMVEAFAGQQVFYRNVVTLLHRTPTQSHKHAESIGRPEEEFMTGGNARRARYFGTSLAAALQRLVDRGALDHVTIASMPEHLMTKQPLVEWISDNRKLDPAVEDRLDVSVVDDADRFFTSLEASPSLGHLG